MSTISDPSTIHCTPTSSNSSPAEPCYTIHIPYKSNPWEYDHHYWSHIFALCYWHVLYYCNNLYMHNQANQPDCCHYNTHRPNPQDYLNSWIFSNSATSLSPMFFNSSFNYNWSSIFKVKLLILFIIINKVVFSNMLTTLSKSLACCLW